METIFARRQGKMIIRGLNKINFVDMKILLLGDSLRKFYAKQISEILSKSPQIVLRQMQILEKEKLIRLIKKNKVKNRKHFEVTSDGQIKICYYLKNLNFSFKNVPHIMQKNLLVLLFHDFGVSLFSKVFFVKYDTCFANFTKIKNKGYLNYNKIKKLNQNRYFLTEKGNIAILKLRKYILNIIENKEISKEFNDLIRGKEK